MASSIRADRFVGRVLLMVACVWVTSMFYFPFEFRAFPSLNTKRMLAVVAIVIIVFKMVHSRDFRISKDFINISILAGIVTFVGIVSVTYNNTPDYTYATYITSAWVWWGAAYTACQFIKWIHKKLTWVLIINYLTAVCVFQCVMALWMDTDIGVKRFVNSIVLQEDLVFIGNVHRLYGIGAALDVAGSRFAAVLIMIIFMLANSSIQKRWYEYFLYFISFIIIVVVGNMIARTTMVGIVIGIIYLAFVSFRQMKSIQHNYMVMWRWIGGLLVLSLPLLIYSYNNDAQMQKHFRFGFEGFFNWVEKGDFNYTSNDRLREMYVWPENIKTWIIGDGYFVNPVDIDPYYTGKRTDGYYMRTDVGYSRFIFYFGLTGLLIFSFYFLNVGRICMRKFPRWKVMFVMLLLLHFAVWAKVATDMFLVFALFLCLDKENQNENENENQNENGNEVVLAPITG